MRLNLDEYEIPKGLRVWREEQQAHQKAHVGTHIDTYRKTPLGESPERMRGVILDVRGQGRIEGSVLDGRDIAGGDFVIFRTGYMEDYGYGSDDYFHSEGAPAVSCEVVDKLIDKGVRFIGIDLHGIQHGRDHKRIDVYCEDRGVYIVENITNLEKAGEEVELQVSWHQEKEASAVPVGIEVLHNKGEVI